LVNQVACFRGFSIDTNSNGTVPLQQKFAILVERVERLRAAQHEALRQAEHLFASLLDRAFSE
jgi:hypothetical protein